MPTPLHKVNVIVGGTAKPGTVGPAVRFADELRGVHIGNPDLDWPQASLP